jgi:hypothetical protein
MIYGTKNLPDSETAKYREDFGSWGKAPPNLKRAASLGETKFNSYSPTLVEFRQFRLDEYTAKQLGLFSPFVNCHMFLYYDNVAVLVTNQWHNGKYHDFFFTCGPCLHEKRTSRNLGRCYNEYTCAACGHVERVDSSD